jgi:hypothetical protein
MVPWDYLALLIEATKEVEMQFERAAFDHNSSAALVCIEEARAALERAWDFSPQKEN